MISSVYSKRESDTIQNRGRGDVVQGATNGPSRAWPRAALIGDNESTSRGRGLHHHHSPVDGEKEEDSISIKEVTGHHDRLSCRTKAATVYDWTRAQLGASTFAPTTVDYPDSQHSHSRAFQASEIYIYNTWIYCPRLERLVPALVLPRARDIQILYMPAPYQAWMIEHRHGREHLYSKPGHLGFPAVICTV